MAARDTASAKATPTSARTRATRASRTTRTRTGTVDAADLQELLDGLYAAAAGDIGIRLDARDPAVLAPVAEWGWQDGLLPGPSAPVWRMDAFRDRFLESYSP